MRTESSLFYTWLNELPKLTRRYAGVKELITISEEPDRLRKIIEAYENGYESGVAVDLRGLKPYSAGIFREYVTLADRYVKAILAYGKLIEKKDIYSSPPSEYPWIRQFIEKAYLSIKEYPEGGGYLLPFAKGAVKVTIENMESTTGGGGDELRQIHDEWKRLLNEIDALIGELRRSGQHQT